MHDTSTMMLGPLPLMNAIENDGYRKLKYALSHIIREDGPHFCNRFVTE